MSLVKTQFLILSPEKTTLIFAFWQGFRGSHGVNQVAKYTSI